MIKNLRKSIGDKELDINICEKKTSLESNSEFINSHLHKESINSESQNYSFTLDNFNQKYLNYPLRCDMITPNITSNEEKRTSLTSNDSSWQNYPNALS